MDFDSFVATLKELISKCDSTLKSGGFKDQKPEDATKDQLIVPFIEALGYTRDFRDTEAQIEARWVDYRLKSQRKNILSFIEAKALGEKSLWEKHKKQVFEYIQTYQALAQTEKPVLWIILTNFQELHIYRLHSGDKPHWQFNYKDYLDNAQLIWELLARENFENDVIEAKFKEEIKTDIDKKFLADLKRWRLILANGFLQSNPEISDEEIRLASQQMIDRFIFIRLLETELLKPYGWIIKQYRLWTEIVKSPEEKFATSLLRKLFIEIGDKFDTELFSSSLCDKLDIEDEFVKAVLFKSEQSDPKVLEVIHKTQIPLFSTENTIYDYDFNTLTIDIMGTVYERFLAHKFQRTNGRIEILDSKELRKKEGIYYTPTPIVKYIVQNTVGFRVKPVLEESLTLLKEKKYKEAYEKISELSKIKVVDPAMGSGSFLLEVFDCFFNAYKKYNSECKEVLENFQVAENNQASLYMGFDEEDSPKKVDNIGVKILTQNIHGVDLDKQAIEVAKLNLWAKLLRSEPNLYRKEAVKLLPNLSQNIKHGNSLISGLNNKELLKEHQARFKDVYALVKKVHIDSDREARELRSAQVLNIEKSISREINEKTLVEYFGNKWEEKSPFIWEVGFPLIFLNNDGSLNEDGGFDIVVGNPPYVRQETLGGFKDYFQQNYEAYHGVADLYTYFIEKGVSLLNYGGVFSYIVANKWMRANYGETLRCWMKGKRIEEIVDFGDLPVFPGATTYPCILRISNNQANKTFSAVQMQTLELDNLSEYVKNHSFVINQESLSDKGWSLTRDTAQSLMDKLNQIGMPLGRYVNKAIYRGVLTGLNEAFVINKETRNNLIFEDPKNADIIKPFLAGHDIKRYQQPTTGKYLIFTKRGVDIKQYPAIEKYLSHFKEKLMPKPKDWKGSDWKGRKLGSYKWYEIQDAVDYYQEFEKPKIMYLVFQVKPAFTFDLTGTYANNAVWIIPNNDKNLLGILNSKLGWFLVSHFCTQIQNGYQLIFKYLEQIPIATPNPKFPITEFVDQMLELNKQMAAVKESFAEQTSQHRSFKSKFKDSYLNEDCKDLIKIKNLLKDINQTGFVSKIKIGQMGKDLALSADCSVDGSSISRDVLSLTIGNETLRDFIFWQLSDFLSINSKKKNWTGKVEKSIYDTIIDAFDELTVFDHDILKNLEVIKEIVKEVKKGCSRTDLGNIENEILETDKTIDQLVYKLYDLTEDEIAIIEGTD